MIDPSGLEGRCADPNGCDMPTNAPPGAGGGSTVYVSPNGQAVIMPSGTTVTTANNGNGTVFTPPGSSCGGNVVRLMGPTQMSPNGYGTVQNSGGSYTNGQGTVVPSNSPAAHIQPTKPWEW